MKISLSITDQEFDKIEPYIECDQWANPIEGEFIFYNPTSQFLMILALNGIEYWLDDQEGNK